MFKAGTRNDSRLRQQCARCDVPQRQSSVVSCFFLFYSFHFSFSFSRRLLPWLHNRVYLMFILDFFKHKNVHSACLLLNVGGLVGEWFPFGGHKRNCLLFVHRPISIRRHSDKAANDDFEPTHASNREYPSKHQHCCINDAT